MAEPPVEVREHYDRDIDEGERLRQGPGLLELARTQEIVRRHLPAGSLRILDVGGGTGVHAAWLADDGHEVHLVDPIERHVEAARRLAGPGRRITAQVGDARCLRADPGSVDAVLLLGPLYHLTERVDRLLALREAARVVRPGGVVFAAGISRFASLFDGLGRGFLFDPEFRVVVERDLRDGGTATLSGGPTGSPPRTSTTRTSCAPRESTPASTVWRSWGSKASPAGSASCSTAGTIRRSGKRSCSPPVPSSPSPPWSVPAPIC